MRQQTADSTRDSGEIDMTTVEERERAEKDAFKPTDRRFKKRKERTTLISFRIKPSIRETMERIADVEGTSMVAVLEKGVEMYDKLLKGQK
jgi:hypothetical protein